MSPPFKPVMPALITGGMVHRDKLKSIVLTVNFDVGDGRIAYIEAATTLDAILMQPKHLLDQIDASIEKFLVSKGLKN